MTEPTDADRERAAEIVSRYDLPNYIGDDIAAALAEERAKGWAPFLALADKWLTDGYADEYIFAAHDIRRAAEQQQ